MQRKLTVWFKPSVIQCFMKALHNPLILKSPYMYSAVFNNPENFYNRYTKTVFIYHQWSRGQVYSIKPWVQSYLGKFHYYNNITYLFRAKES